MAEQRGKRKNSTSTGSVQATVETNGEEEVKFEPIKQIETDTFNTIKSVKTFSFVVIGLLAYLIFMILPGMEDKINYIEKDLTAILTQSDRYKQATRVFAKDNVCAQCHLEPDYLLHNLQAKYPSFADLKAYMEIGHQRVYTMTTPLADDQLMEVYRTLK